MMIEQHFMMARSLALVLQAATNNDCGPAIDAADVSSVAEEIARLLALGFEG